MTTPPRIPVTLSTSSVYPLLPAAAFRIGSQLGYDGVEVMVLADPVTQDATALRRLARAHEAPILSIHAPTLLVSQRVYGTSDPWEKIDRSIDLALAVECRTIVVHPPFRWQKEYAREFVEGIAERENDRGVRLAVENMFPWRAGRTADVPIYRPSADPVPQPYDNVTLDLSHTATAGDDALEMQAALGGRLAHVHLADGAGSMMDEHLVPGRGSQPCAEFLRRLGASDYSGVVAVEVGTRRSGTEGRDADLTEALEFARRHLDEGLRTRAQG